MSLNDTGFDYQGSVSSNWANGEISRRDAIIATQDSELSTLRAENERLRERCEAAEKCINATGRVSFARVEIEYTCGGWEVECTDTGDVIGSALIDEDGDSEVDAELFDDWYSAYQAAIAAGWLPTETKLEKES